MMALALLTTGGCVASTGEDLTRAAARSVISRTLVSNYPGLPVEPTLSCIIDNATTPELVSLASDSVTGPTAATVQTVSTVATRAGTLQCLSRGGVSFPT